MILGQIIRKCVKEQGVAKKTEQINFFEIELHRTVDNCYIRKLADVKLWNG